MEVDSEERIVETVDNNFLKNPLTELITQVKNDANFQRRHMHSWRWI